MEIVKQGSSSGTQSKHHVLSRLSQGWSYVLPCSLSRWQNSEPLRLISSLTIRFYTDSKVILGCIYNQTRRFHIYVSNRVQRIRKSTTPEQWYYVPTHLNPADDTTKSVPAAHLRDTTWLTGPAFLLCLHQEAAKSHLLRWWMRIQMSRSDLWPPL